MAATALWFGIPPQRLFGWVHRPEPVMAAPAVLLCPPLGRELTNAHHAHRRLAESLSAAGITVIRFDYQGTGDSAGDEHGAGQVQGWLASIESAAALARQQGASSISLVGMRMGALLAEIAAERVGELAALVLWDPCVSGKAFVRHQRALELLRGRSEADARSAAGSPGGLIDEQTLADLRELTAPRQTRTAQTPTLILHRPQDPALADLRERHPGGDVVLRAITGQRELLDVEALHSITPEQTISQITQWLAATLAGQLDSAAPHPGAPTPADETALVAAVSARGEVRERIVKLGQLGLFGIETRAQRFDPARPTIVFLNTGKDWHVGSNRLWVRMAREWAGLGFRCVRFDLSGLGDSPVRSGQQPQVVRAPQAFEDVAAAVNALSEENPSNVVLVGLCSGAYQALESGLKLKPRGILAVNPLLRFAPPEMAGGDSIDPRRRICTPTTSPTMRAYRQIVSPSLRRVLLPAVSRAKRLLAPRQRQSRWLAELTGAGVDVFCICGEQEVHQLPEVTSRSSPTSPGSGSLRVEVIEDLDHALIPPAHQELVDALLTRHLREHYGAHADA